MVGRKRMPTALRVLRGNPQKRPLNQHEPKPDAIDPEIPEELHGNPIAAKEWKSAIVPAIRIGQITIADRALAIVHCELWSSWRRELAAAAKGPIVITAGAQNIPRPNPARVQALRTGGLLAHVDEKLGLTPTARSRINAVLMPGAPATAPTTSGDARARFVRDAGDRG
jgi:phage terminase small subunit